MNTRAIRVLLIGDAGRAEFREAVAELRQSADLLAVDDTKGALDVLDSGEIVPDLMVVAQAFPGQFTAEDIDRLRPKAPLARVIGLMGSWCEGEVRTGKPWPAAIRVYWHQWPGRCRRELRRLAAGEGSTWALPVTASDEEQFLAAADAPVARHRGLVLIYSRQFEMQDWLASACRRIGYATVWMQPGRSPRAQGAVAAVFDFSGSVQSEVRDLESLAENLRPAPVVALLNFPRLDERDRVLAAGAAAALSKPLLLGDLFEQLDAVLRQQSPTGG
ncbi:MAG: hypothetical protein HUU20_12095 [Pirellulales bacterium]|nr:hypothetical protein [Pirellulales bacterium]